LFFLKNIFVLSILQQVHQIAFVLSADPYRNASSFSLLLVQLLCRSFAKVTIQFLQSWAKNCIDFWGTLEKVDSMDWTNLEALKGTSLSQSVGWISLILNHISCWFLYWKLKKSSNVTIIPVQWKMRNNNKYVIFF